MNSPAIDFQNVYKSFRKHQVLRGMNLRVEPGTTFALLGVNGAGKTTAIRMLLGLLHPDEGFVSVLGRSPEVEPIAVRQSVGYLAEDQTMYGWMRCDEILRFMAPFYPTWDHQLALGFARDFEVPLGTKIKHLSKGQNVRLGLVLALAHRPEVVILDDPALGLDPIMRNNSTATSSRTCRARDGRCFTVRTCSTRSSRGRRGGDPRPGADRKAERDGGPA